MIGCSCSGNPNKVADKTTDKEQITETADANTNLKPEELKIHPGKFRILPVDESAEDKSLQAFVERLKKITKQKDTDGLITCLDTGIVVSWGGGMYGLETFLEEWKLNKQPERSKFWATMQRYMTLGGAWDDNKKEFRFPYAQSNRFFQNMDFDFDWYVTAICISPETDVYQKPLPNAKKIALLSYEVVKIIDPGSNFIEIQTIDKKITGFVKSEQLILSADPHPILEKVNREWKIVSFAPFD